MSDTLRKKPGRPPMYNAERVSKICELLSKGETKENAAKMVGISPAILYDWQNRYPEFLEAVKRAQAEFENWQMNGILESAKKSLKTLIEGCEYEEVKTEYEQDPKNPSNPRIKKQTRTTKRILPSPTAVIFALCNRDPEHWQNRVTNDINGRLETESVVKPDLSNVPDDLLAQVIESIQRK